MSLSKHTVAVLDDEPEMRKALRRLLTGRGFSVDEYDCGRKLLATMDSHPLDCLVLDLHLPEMDGFEVLKALGLRSIRMPVIVITGLDEPGTAERVRSLGACAYLKKPVDRETLLSAIRSAVAAHDEGAKTSDREDARG